MILCRCEVPQVGGMFSESQNPSQSPRKLCYNVLPLPVLVELVIYEVQDERTSLEENEISLLAVER